MAESLKKREDQVGCGDSEVWLGPQGMLRREHAARHKVERMTLPVGARARLTEPLRAAATLQRTARDYHTLPIESTPWRVYSDALGRCLAKLRNELTLPDRSFNGLRDHIVVILRERSRAAGMLRTLEPFQPYDPMRAEELLDVLDNLPVAVISAVEAEAPLSGELILALDDAAVFWAECEARCAPGTALRSAFEMPHDPTDAQGSFRPELVLQHYAHRAEPLLCILVPHLVSVGVPYVKDALAGIAIVGRILNGEDPVLAYLATDMLSRGYLGADPAVAAEARSHLGASEAALRRTEHSTRLALIAAKVADDDMEARALRRPRERG